MTERFAGDEGLTGAGAEPETEPEATAGEELVENAGPGAQLRAAREARGLTIEQVAAATRIPMRHLDMIERGDFQALPARTYAVGFSRTYAKLLELDADAIVAEVRSELDARPAELQHRPVTFEPGDPARVPSRGLFWLAIVGGVAVVALGYFFMRTMFTPAAELPSLVEQQAAEDAALAEASARESAAPAGDQAPSGPVVFTAREEGIWVKFYDAAGRQLMQKQMALGESYTVPTDVAGPQLWTGRPDALAISIGGREIAPLSREQRIMRDVPIDAEALLARDGAGANAAGDAGANAGGAASPTG